MNKLFCLLFFVMVFSFPNEIYSQKTVIKGYTVIDGSGKTIDLSETVAEKCSQTIRIEIGSNFVEVRFQPQFAAEAGILVEELKSSITETRKLLFPLKINSVRFYLLQMDNAPTAFFMYEKKQMEEAYVHLEMFKKPNDIIVNNQSIKSCRADIFHVIPHELTHPALASLIADEKTRWFNDGFAEYIGSKVAEKFYPDYNQGEATHVPPVSLNRTDIRENLLLWKEPTLKYFQKNQKGTSQRILLLRCIFPNYQRNCRGSGEKGNRKSVGNLADKFAAK